MNKTAIVIACLVVIGIGFAVNVLHVVYNQTDNFLAGYDHPVVPVLMDLYNRYHPFGDDYTIGGNTRALNLYTWFSLLMVEIFGLNVPTLFAVQAIAYFLMLVFAFLLARELTDDSPAGWLAAAILAVTPLCYGPARTFTYWPYMIAFFFGVVLMSLRYHRAPTWWRALLIGLLFSLMTATTYDRTSRYLVMANGYAFVGLAFAERFVSARLPRWRIVLHAVLTFCVSTSELFFRYLLTTAKIARNPAEAVWFAVERLAHFFNPLTLSDYRDQAIQDTIVSAPWHSTLLSYVSAWFFHGLGPVIFLFVLVSIIAAFRFIRPAKRLMWWILPVVLFIALSVIPRKAPWFTLFVGAYFIVLSAVSLFGWLKHRGWRRQIPVVLVCLALILGQYFFLSFVHVLRVPAWAAPIPNANTPSCRNPVFMQNPETQYMMTQAFLDKYHALYDDEPIRLMPLFLYTHPHVMEFYLRTRAPQISLHNADEFQTLDVLFWMWHPGSSLAKMKLVDTYRQGDRPQLETYLLDDWLIAYRTQCGQEASAETVAAFREKISAARLDHLAHYNLVFLWK
ncbi:MAG TPA: glycosyltransferase family 39 protein [bacterium]|nr:glycosyltransferase family 39 protein [bacterium]